MTGCVHVMLASGSLPTASITPPSVSNFGSASTSVQGFTASISSGTPTAYAWSVDNGAASIVAGQGTSFASVQITCAPSESDSTTVTCNVTCPAGVFAATAFFSYVRS